MKYVHTDNLITKGLFTLSVSAYATSATAQDILPLFA